MKNLKRVLSLMMAVLLCFGLFPGSALAAENDYDGYLAMIEYKDRRYSLSENLPAPFGGRTTEEFFELRINDLRTYRTAYCIQMGVDEFQPAVFKKMISRIIAGSQALRFQLINGLELVEPIERWPI